MLAGKFESAFILPKKDVVEMEFCKNNIYRWKISKHNVNVIVIYDYGYGYAHKTMISELNDIKA